MTRVPQDSGVPPASEAAAPIQEALDTLYHVGAGHKHWPPAELYRRSRHGSEALAALEARLAEAEEQNRGFIRDGLQDAESMLWFKTRAQNAEELLRALLDAHVIRGQWAAKIRAALPPESETR